MFQSFVDVLTELRPRQWTKNAVVLAAFFFAMGDKNQHVTLALLGPALLAAVVFSITSSAIYVFNDILDVARDRRHPVKCRRPVAAGRISIAAAWVMSAICLAVGGGGAWLLSHNFAALIAGYVVLQVIYTLWLKHVSLVDVFIIAIGFVMRAIAGAVVIAVTISPWLLICTFLMALFLALCKRRHEKRMVMALDASGVDTRPSLLASNERLLDQLIAVTAGAVIVIYAIYTLWPDTVAKFGTTNLCFTLPFVCFGLFRYLDLVYRMDKGDQPESILLTDLPLMISIALFGISVLVLIDL